MIREERQFRFSGPAIIYCPTRSATEKIAGVLKSMLQRQIGSSLISPHFWDGIIF